MAGDDVADDCRALRGDGRGRLWVGLWLGVCLSVCGAEAQERLRANGSGRARAGSSGASSVRLNASGQRSETDAAVSPGTADALVELATHAGVIFAGRVEAVTRSDAAGFVDVRFHIDEAVLGCPKSSTYVLREWAGLWTGHAARYSVGQHLLMLLTPRGPAGMSAPVAGAEMAGAIPIVAGGQTPLARGTGVGPAEDGMGLGAPAVDLRWVQTRVVRTAGASARTGRVHSASLRRGPVARSAIEQEWSTSSETSVDETRGGLVLLPLVPSGGVDAANRRSGLNTVLALLRAGDGGGHSAR